MCRGERRSLCRWNLAEGIVSVMPCCDGQGDAAAAKRKTDLRRQTLPWVQSLRVRH